MKKLITSLTLDSIKFGFSIIFLKISLIFLMPILTRVLEPAIYGQIDLLSNLSGFMGVLLLFGMDHSFALEFNKARSKKEIKDIISQTFFSRVVHNIILFPFLLILMVFIFFYLENYNFNFFTFLVLLASTHLMSIFVFFLELLRLEKKIKYFILLIVIQVVCCIFFIILFVCFFQWSTFGYFISWLLSYLISIFCFLKKSYKMFLKSNFSLKSYKKQIERGFPQVPFHLMPWFLIFKLELIFLLFVSENSVGIFAVSSRLILFLSNSLELLRRSIWPRLIIHTKSKQSSMLNLLFVFLMISFFLILIIKELIPFFIKFLAGNTYYDAIKFIPLLGILMVCFSLNFLFNLNFMKQKNKYISWLIFGIVLLNSFVLVFLPSIKFQIMTILYSIVFAAISGNLLGIVFLSYHVRVKIKILMLYIGFLISCFLFLVL